MNMHDSSPLIEFYHALRDRLQQRLEKHEEERSSVAHLLQELRESGSEWSELSREEVDAVAGYLQRDLESAGTFLAETGEDIERWFQLEETLLEDRLRDLFTQLADPTRVALDRLDAAARAEQIYQQGELLGMGSLVCTECGHTMNFDETVIIPACPQCGATTFHRTPQ